MAEPTAFAQGPSARRWVVGGTMAGVGLRLVLLAVVASRLDPDPFGWFVLLTSVALVGAEAGRFGLGRGALRLVGQARAGATPIPGSGDLHALNRTLASTVTLSGFGAGLVAGAVVATLVATVDSLPGRWPLVPAVGLWVVADSIRLPLAEAQRAEGRIRAATLLGDPGRAAAAVLAVVVAVSIEPSLTAVVVASAAASLTGATLALTTTLARAPSGPALTTSPDPTGVGPAESRAYADVGSAGLSDPTDVGPAESRASADVGSAGGRSGGAISRRSILGVGRGLVVVDLVNVALRYTVPWTAAWLLSVADAGRLNLALRATGVIALTLQALGTYVGPAVVTSDVRDATTALSARLGRQGNRVLMVAAGLAVVIVGLVPLAIVTVLDGDGAELAIVVAILAVAQVVNVATGPAGQILALTGHERRVLTVTVVIGALATAAGVVGAVLAGGPGLALAVAAGTIVRNIVLAGDAHTRSGVDPRAGIVRPLLGRRSRLSL